MSHVQIKSLPDGAFSMIVDGVEMAHNVLAEGLTIEFPKEPGHPVTVRMALAGDTVNLDLHHAVVTHLDETIRQATVAVEQLKRAVNRGAKAGSAAGSSAGRGES